MSFEVATDFPACDCPADGFCSRYKRTMLGRLREICRGENIDPVAAEQYRRTWASQVPTPLEALQQSLERWQKAGSPSRPAERVLEIFTTCQGCEHFQPDPNLPQAGECNACGCRLSQEVEPWNKIALATEGCPIGKWSADVVVPGEAPETGCCGSAYDSLSQETPVYQVQQLLAKPAPNYNKEWNHWGNVNRAHTRLFNEAAAQSYPYPGGFSGRGIVSCVSAKPGYSSGKNLEHGYFPAAWVMLHELRRHGCTLPVTFCHLGPFEWDPLLTELVKPLGVDVIDLRAWDATPAGGMRIMNGWETKIAAILAAPYEEVLFLDADNIPIRDPAPLFDHRDYRETGAAFWPDVPPSRGDHKEWLPEVVWRNAGMDYRHEVDFETGQILVDKSKCWNELQLARHLNEHSDYWYDQIFGDKSTFHLAWAKLNRGYSMPPHGVAWNGAALLQYDLERPGNLLFEHCVQNKPTLHAFPHGEACLTNPGECLGHLAALRQKWNGRLWSPDAPTSEADAALVAGMIGRRFTYRRLGLGERTLRFLEDNRIGRGMGKCEVSWCVVGGTLAVLDIDGHPTFFAKPDEFGRWRGRWEQHEKCEVELVPE